MESGGIGHNDVKTTMIYTHVLNRGPAGVRALSMPFDLFIENIMPILIKIYNIDIAMKKDVEKHGDYPGINAEFTGILYGFQGRT